MRAALKGGTGLVIVVIILVVVAFGCATCGVLAILGKSAEVTDPSGKPRPKLVPKVRMTASQGSEEELTRALQVLKRRLEAAGIAHEIDRFQLRFTVRLEEDSLTVAKATKLMLAGGDLVFKIMPKKGTDLGNDAYDAEIKKVLDAKKARQYDPKTARYDALPYEGEYRLLENPGFAGYSVAQASYAFAERAPKRALAADSPAGASSIAVSDASSLQVGQVVRIDAPLSASKVTDAGEGSGEAAAGPFYRRIEGLAGDRITIEPVPVALAKGTPVVLGYFEITYTMTPEGGRDYLKYAISSAHRTEATILDDEIVTVATWGEVTSNQDPLQPYTWSNTGEWPWDKDKAEYLSTLMTSGRLPIDLTLEEE